MITFDHKPPVAHRGKVAEYNEMVAGYNEEVSDYNIVEKKKKVSYFYIINICIISDIDRCSMVKSTSDKKTTYKIPISRRPAILKYCIGYFWKQMLMNLYFEFNYWYTLFIKDYNMQTDFHF